MPYADTIAALGAALRLFRASEVRGAGKASSPPACVCSCGRRIRVAPSVLAAGPITRSVRRRLHTRRAGAVERPVAAAWRLAHQLTKRTGLRVESSGTDRVRGTAGTAGARGGPGGLERRPGA